MSKWLRFCRRGLTVGVACGLFLAAITVGEARAGIMITMSINGGGPVDITPLFAPFAADPGQLNSLGSPDLDTINSLVTPITGYSFTALGGSSNFTGTPAGGALTVSGEVSMLHSGVPGSFVTITETESGFLSPSGPAGILSSSSTGNFNQAGIPNHHVAQSSFNGMATPPYLVASLNTGTDDQGNMATAKISPFVTPYTLSNSITFFLTPDPIRTPVDGFSVTAGISAVPEPASVVMMSTSMPLIGVGVVLLRRRRAKAKT
jgi:hypothetical protein